MKPAITITEKSIRVSTDAFDLTLEFRQTGTSVDELRESYKRMNEAIDEHVSNNYSITEEPEPELIQEAGRKLKLKERQCVFCGTTYLPTGTTQRFCSKRCKAISNRKKPLSEMEEAELDATLKEIEQRQKHYKL